MKLLNLLLSAIMPERIIRILFISSLYDILFKHEVLDPSICSKLNKIMDVANNDSALGLGMKLSKVIWNGRELKIIDAERNEKGELKLSQSTLDEITEHIIKSTPEWLLYDPLWMKHDVRNLLAKCH